MITLCGFSVSNYYNKVKLALLEKGIAFDEERVMTKPSDEAVLPARRWARCRSSAPSTARCAKARSIVELPGGAGAAAAADAGRPLAGGQGARAGRPSSTCTWSWWRASCMRRPSSAARSSDEVRERACASCWASTSPASSGWRSSRPTSPATPSRRPTARPTSACRWWRMATQGGAGRGPAGRRRHRLEGLRQADRRAAQRAAGGGRPQGRHRAHGGRAGQDKR